MSTQAPASGPRPAPSGSRGGHPGPGSRRDLPGRRAEPGEGSPSGSRVGGWGGPGDETLPRGLGLGAPAAGAPGAPKQSRGEWGLRPTALFLGPFPEAWATWSSSRSLARERAWLRQQVPGVGGARRGRGRASVAGERSKGRPAPGRSPWMHNRNTVPAPPGGRLPPGAHAAVRAATMGAPSPAQAPRPHPGRTPQPAELRPHAVGRSCSAVAPGVALGCVIS